MRLLRKLTFPFALLYGAVVYLRNFLYDVGIFKSKTTPIPSICVGNLSVGGTGKTPMVALLATELGDTYKTAVLSRGYKRKSIGFQLADENSNVAQLGDEPYLLHKNLPNIQIAVDTDRYHGIQQLKNNTATELVILDDAFQHRKVLPDYAVLLTSFDNPYPKDFYLPMGNLRDAKNQAKRANAIVVTKCPSKMDDSTKQRLKELIRPNADQLLLFSQLSHSDTLFNGMSKLGLSDLKQTTNALLTGIANPNPLVDYLEMHDIEFKHFQYPDHYDFTEKELDKLKTYDNVITTEKDFVRINGRLANAFYIKVSHEFIGDGRAQLLKHIGKTLNLG